MRGLQRKLQNIAPRRSTSILNFRLDFHKSLPSIREVNNILAVIQRKESLSMREIMAVETTISPKENSRSIVSSFSNSVHLCSTLYFESTVKKHELADSLGSPTK